MSLVSIKLAILECSACPARREARLPVPFSGPETVRIAIVGRNPGRQEDEQGEPFIGRGGDLLNQALTQAGIDRSKLYVTNLLKCYTSGDRPPVIQEYQACVPRHLLLELQALKPAVVVFLGNDASLFWLGQRAMEMRQRLVPLPLVSPTTLATATVHPGYALRVGDGRKILFKDFRWLATQPVVAAALGTSLGFA